MRNVLLPAFQRLVIIRAIAATACSIVSNAVLVFDKKVNIQSSLFEVLKLLKRVLVLSALVDY